MINLSRRSLAKYAADKLMADESPTSIAKHLGAVLTAEGKTAQAEYLVADVLEVLEERNLLARAEIKSVRPLDENLRSRLISWLRKSTGAKDISLNETIAPELIGGLKIETAKHSWDMSIARRLAELERSA